jgi:ubiquinone/menaquinone biosynthesis C-methylase UbiE
MKPDSPASSGPSNQHAAEALLRSHPGVREAAALAWSSKNSVEEICVGYVVPNDEYLERIFAGDEWKRKRIQKWRKTFDLSQFGKETVPTEPGFNIAGWNSSYTRQAIPAEHMREWVELTVRELQSFKPREVLEIGCGTGLLLLRVAAGCTRYVGTDVSSAVLAKLRKQMEEMGGEWNNVTLLERSAENLEGFAEGSFDTVILNSVVKYFPNVSYLLQVLEGVLRLVKPGGRIFIGDVRSLPLLEAHAASIELHQAPATLSLAELRDRVNHRLQLEDQLVLSPAFFPALRERLPKINGVEVHPKPGRFDNEMTRFRFNAILRLQSPMTEPLEASFLDWSEQRLRPDSISALVRDKQPESLAFKNVANARIEKDIAALKELDLREEAKTVGELRQSLEARELWGVDPQTMWALGEELGYRVDISWAAARPVGSYDVVFRKLSENRDFLTRPIAWPQPLLGAKQLSEYANLPGRSVLHAELSKQLIDYCRQSLPNEQVPAELFVIDALPLTGDGKIDFPRLPAPSARPG